MSFRNANRSRLPSHWCTSVVTVIKLAKRPIPVLCNFPNSVLDRCLGLASVNSRWRFECPLVETLSSRFCLLFILSREINSLSAGLCLSPTVDCSSRCRQACPLFVTSSELEFVCRRSVKAIFAGARSHTQTGGALPA